MLVVRSQLLAEIEGNLTYELDGGEVEITALTSIEIPPTVTSLESSA